MSGLLGHVRATDRDGLRQIASLPILVGERRKVSPGILVELPFQFLYPGGYGHLGSR
jgi:hypothetical protein